ncbi:MAG: hypothetical protein JWQ71_214 [Pedosphaera sp.]|nr:hypothetical protein [Pedosphaera sp.]
MCGGGGSVEVLLEGGLVAGGGEDVDAVGGGPTGGEEFVDLAILGLAGRGGVGDGGAVGDEEEDVFVVATFEAEHGDFAGLPIHGGATDGGELFHFMREGVIGIALVGAEVIADLVGVGAGHGHVVGALGAEGHAVAIGGEGLFILGCKQCPRESEDKHDGGGGQYQQRGAAQGDDAGPGFDVVQEDLALESGGDRDLFELAANGLIVGAVFLEPLLELGVARNGGEGFGHLRIGGINVAGTIELENLFGLQTIHAAPFESPRERWRR